MIVLSSNLKNMKIKRQSSLLMNTWINSHFFFFLLLHEVLLHVSFFFLSVSKFNLKYKTKLQSNYDVEAFSLAEIQYKNLQC